MYVCAQPCTIPAVGMCGRGAVPRLTTGEWLCDVQVLLDTAAVQKNGSVASSVLLTAGSETAQAFYPMFFGQDHFFEELFCICIQLVNKTWKEMRATQEDFDKVITGP